MPDGEDVEWSDANEREFRRRYVEMRSVGRQINFISRLAAYKGLHHECSLYSFHKGRRRRRRRR